MRTQAIFFLFLAISLQGVAQEIAFVNADGFFSIGTKTNRSASITLIDMDKDGDLDALVANGRHWAEQNYLYYNDGFGGFKLAKPIGNCLDASYNIQSADFNNDGYLDIAVANDSRIDDMIYFGNAENSYLLGKPIGSQSPSRNMAIADIDRDGDMDIILSNRRAKNEILLNKGNGEFTSTIHFGEDTDLTIQTRVVDINNDGHWDLVTAERKSPNKIYINDGNQSFANVLQFGEAEDETRAVAIADFNNDGFLDIVCGNLNAANKIYYGTKNLDYTESFAFESSRETSSIEIADLNNDGHLDIIEGNFEDRNYVYMANDQGGFTEVGLREDLKDDTYHITVGDIDSNGLPDIIVSNSDALNLFYKTRK